MSKSKFSEKELNRKVTAVWLYQKDKRFLLNYFNSYEMARNYVRAFSYMKINGEILIGEVSIVDLINM